MAARSTKTVETRERLSIPSTRMVHFEHPLHVREAWCGAPTVGTYTSGGVDCVVCADLNRAYNWHLIRASLVEGDGCAT